MRNVTEMHSFPDQKTMLKRYVEKAASLPIFLIVKRKQRIDVGCGERAELVFLLFLL